MESRAGDGLTPLLPLARALRAAVPERPADDGLFGPASVVWRLHRDRSFPIASIRSLMLQALHPLAMAGVADHSDWRRDPFGRLEATSRYVLTVTYGERAAAAAAAVRVRAVHAHVHGIDSVTGLPYDAEDPALLLWVHAAMVDSVVRVVERYGRALEPGDADRYVAEMVPFAAIVGVPDERVPATVADLDGYLRSVELVQATPAARDAIGYVLNPGVPTKSRWRGADFVGWDPPDLDGDTRETWRDLGQVAIGTLPEWARALYGFAMPPAEALERQAVRQLLGVLDLGFESLPGVLEARQRIELRVRARTR
jgi:uncharacterized protein (DUF2236 family)